MRLKHWPRWALTSYTPGFTAWSSSFATIKMLMWDKLHCSAYSSLKTWQPLTSKSTRSSWSILSRKASKIALPWLDLKPCSAVVSWSNQERNSLNFCTLTSIDWYKTWLRCTIYPQCARSYSSTARDTWNLMTRSLWLKALERLWARWWNHIRSLHWQICCVPWVWRATMRHLNKLSMSSKYCISLSSKCYQLTISKNSAPLRSYPI